MKAMVIVFALLVGCGPTRTSQEKIVDYEGAVKRWAAKMEVPVSGVVCNSIGACALRSEDTLIGLECNSFDSTCYITSRSPWKG